MAGSGGWVQLPRNILEKSEFLLFHSPLKGSLLQMNETRTQNYIEQSLPSELYSKALPYCFNVQICRKIFTVKLIDNIGHPFTILIFFLLMGCKVNVSMPFYTEHQNNFPHMQQIILSSLFFFSLSIFMLVLISFKYWLTIGRLKMFYMIEDDLEKLNLILFSLAQVKA